MSTFVVELKKIYRQTQPGFLKGLHAIRMKRDHHKAIDAFNHKCYRRPEHDQSVILTAYRSSAETINQDKLNALPGPDHTFYATVTGDFKLNDNNLPAPKILVLRDGARVMVTKNIGGGIVNGTMGTVKKIDRYGIIVQIDAGSTIYMTKETWQNFGYEYNTLTKHIESTQIGSYVQYPLILGWAITIHKSQGLSLDAVDIDFGRGAFSSGQAYVALSRCRTLDGLTFRRLLTHKDIILDPKVVEFYELNFGEVVGE